MFLLDYPLFSSTCSVLSVNNVPCWITYCCIILDHKILHQTPHLDHFRSTNLLLFFIQPFYLHSGSIYAIHILDIQVSKNNNKKRVPLCLCATQDSSFQGNGWMLWRPKPWKTQLGAPTSARNKSQEPLPTPANSEHEIKYRPKQNQHVPKVLPRTVKNRINKPQRSYYPLWPISIALAFPQNETQRSRYQNINDICCIYVVNICIYDWYFYGNIFKHVQTCECPTLGLGPGSSYFSTFGCLSLWTPPVVQLNNLNIYFTER